MYKRQSASCLIRGTDYGRGNGKARYVWALVPDATYLAVAMAPRHAADHPYVENRWELFVDGQYVMPMTCLLYTSTSAAAVAIAFDEARRTGRFGKGDNVVLVTFGAGLTWGAAAIRW